MREVLAEYITDPLVLDFFTGVMVCGIFSAGLKILLSIFNLGKGGSD